MDKARHLLGLHPLGEVRLGHGEAIGLSIHCSRQDAVNVDVVRLEFVCKDFAELVNRPFGNGICGNAIRASARIDPLETVTIPPKF